MKTVQGYAQLCCQFKDKKNYCFFPSVFSSKMGGLSFALLALMFVKLMAEADVFQSKENNREESCITGKCARKRAVQLDQEESKRMNKIQPSEAKKNCISWRCKREMLLRSRFLKSNRAALAAAAKIKQLGAAEEDEVAQARKLQPQMTVDEEPCLTKVVQPGNDR